MKTPANYPRQFWFLIAGMVVSAAGSSLVWPFLTIYLHRQMGVSLGTIGILYGLGSAAKLLTTLVAGPVVDRFGRKGVMVLSLLGGSAAFAAMIVADSLSAWAIIMTARGAFEPLFSIGSDAMVADLLAPADRPNGYSVLRMGHNIGIAIGPILGGFVVSVSYTLSFAGAAVTNLIFMLLIVLAIRETLPAAKDKANWAMPVSGYARIMRDRPFLAFCGLYTVAIMPSAILMIMLPVYAGELIGMPESQYGFIMATNAIMVVLLQYPITQLTVRFRPLLMLALGALLYALGAGSVALGNSFTAFLLSMAILTLGEMVLAPTGTTWAANLAPSDMRGRYMGVYGLSWGVGIGVGPMIGGFLNDRIAPLAIWYGSFLLGAAASLGFLWQSSQDRFRHLPTTTAKGRSGNQ